MFNGLRNQIVELNKDVNNVANSKKAKKLRKKLVTIGLILGILGFGGAFTCFTLFVINGIYNDSFEPGLGIIIPFILFVPCGGIGGIGMMIFHMGLSIVITGYTTNLINETVTMKCPECGDPISPNEMFCTKCGHKLRNQCSKCGFINEPEDKFCAKCGNEL